VTSTRQNDTALALLRTLLDGDANVQAPFRSTSNHQQLGRKGEVMSDSHIVNRHERLWTIAGRWATSGSVIGEPPLPVVGTDVYEVLAGGHFLVHHVDVTVGSQEVRAIEIIGEADPENSDGYLARSFDSDGNAEVMRLTIDDEGTFHFSGGPDVASAAQPKGTATVRVRSTLRVAEDGASMSALWERSEDGASWQPWMDMTFTREPKGG
jgi:hypothetical protein